MAKDKMGIITFGAIAGGATPYLLKFIVTPVLNFLGQFTPSISAKLANSAPVIDINVRNSLTGINGGLSAWLVDAFGFTLNIPGQAILMGAIGGALLFWLGATVAEMMSLGGSARAKVGWSIFLGSFGAALILGGFAVPSIDITLVNTLLAFGINAAILSGLYVWIDKSAKLNIVPF